MSPLPLKQPIIGRLPSFRLPISQLNHKSEGSDAAFKCDFEPLDLGQTGPFLPASFIRTDGFTAGVNGEPEIPNELFPRHDDLCDEVMALSPLAGNPCNKISSIHSWAQIMTEQADLAEEMT